MVHTMERKENGHGTVIVLEQLKCDQKTESQVDFQRHQWPPCEKSVAFIGEGVHL